MASSVPQGELWARYGEASYDTLAGAARIYSGDVIGGGAQLAKGVGGVYGVIRDSFKKEAFTNPATGFTSGKAIRWLGDWSGYYKSWYELFSRASSPVAAVSKLRFAAREAGLSLTPEQAARVVTAIWADPVRQLAGEKADPRAASLLAVLALWIGSPAAQAPISVPSNKADGSKESKVFFRQGAFDYLEGLASLGPSSPLSQSAALAVAAAAPEIPGSAATLALLRASGASVNPPSPDARSGSVKVR